MWQTVKISDICTIKGRIGYRGYTKGDLVEPGEGAISLSPSNIISNKINFTKSTYISWEKYYESPEIMLEIDDIVFCKTASIGKLAIVEDLPVETTLNPQFVVLKNIHCDNRFLYYAIQSSSFSSQISGIIGGTAIPTLSQKNLGELVISLPPLAEQQRIVVKLDAAFAEIDDAIRVTEDKFSLAEKSFLKILADIFYDSDVGEEVLLGDVCELSQGLAINRRTKHLLTEKSSKPLLRIKDLINNTEEKYVTDSYQNPSTEVCEKDLIFTRTGSLGLVFTGRVGVLHNNSFKIETKSIISKKYLYWWLQNPKFLSDIHRIAKKAAQPDISHKLFKSQYIRVPKLEMQSILHGKAKKHFELKQKFVQVNKKKLTQLYKLKKAVLIQELQPSEAA